MEKLAKTQRDVADEILKMSKDDYVGLWVLISAVRNDFRPVTEGDVRSISLGIVKIIMQKGLRPGYLEKKGGFEYWSGSDQEKLKRIEIELQKSEKMDFGTCWFST